jgi:hypothetical protein
MRISLVAVVGTSLVFVASWSHPAQACSGGSSAAPTAFPASGAANVSPYTSIIIAAGASQPSGLTLDAGGQTVTLPSILTLGSGLLGSSIATFYRLPLYLATSTSYTLSALDNGTSRELTHFTTAAGYDKAPGQAPVIDRLRLWRVRYPVEQVAAGGCVFDEYEGYIDVDYQDGSVPNTPANEIVTVLSLQTKTGSSTQKFVFAGLSHFDGAQVQNAMGSALVDVPDGGFPSPVYALWKPTLEPDREYCVSMTLYGRNDQAMPQVTSNNVCATVTNLDARPGINDAAAPPVDTAPPDTRVVKDSEFPSLDAGTDEPSTPPVSLDASLVLPDASSPQPDAAIAPAADTAVAQGADATQPGDAVAVVLADAPPASDAPAVSPPKKNGCGCNLGGGEKSTAPVVLWAALLVLWAPSRRRRAR